MYGLSVERYNEILENQDGRCAICKKLPGPRLKRLAVDHDHKTGAVRGLLCFRCNYGIGWFSDNRELFETVAGYLGSGIDWRDLSGSNK